MKKISMVAILIIAGLLGIVAALWSGSGHALGPVRIMGEGAISEGIQYTVMVLALIGGIGAVLMGVTVNLFGQKLPGIASLVFAAFLVPSVFQGNVLSILAIILLIIVGLTRLVAPPKEPEGTIAE